MTRSNLYKSLVVLVLIFIAGISTYLHFSKPKEIVSTPVVVPDVPVQATVAPANFSGDWDWKSGKEELNLYLEQKGTALSGWHNAIGQNGNKVDAVDFSEPPSVSGTVKGNIATLNFRSGFPDSDGKGTAKITFHKGANNNDTIDWEIITSTGEMYLPLKATLIRDVAMTDSM